MNRPDPIHSEHCRCSLCEPLRRKGAHSGTLMTIAVVASILVALALLTFLGSHVRELMLTVVTL